MPEPVFCLGSRVLITWRQQNSVNAVIVVVVVVVVVVIVVVVYFWGGRGIIIHNKIMRQTEVLH